MPAPLVAGALWSVIKPLLPREPAKQKGGRPPVPARAALSGILFVLRTGIDWEMLPPEMGCGSGVTCCWRRLRGRPGTKRHLVTDRAGIPLALILTGANAHDSTQFEPLLDAIPPLRRTRGRPRRRPEKLHADKGYDYRRCREACRRRGIKHRIARRGVNSSQRLGRHRWVIERSFAWINRSRRLAIRYERRADIHLAFTTFACALITLSTIEGRF